jgi:hypothetical protein
MKFIQGQSYSRLELREYLGSGHTQQGILWSTGNPPLRPGEVILTTGGRHGKAAGYANHELDDGSWVYFGQGTSGDHELSRRANKQLIDSSNVLLLFSTKEPTSKEASEQGNHQKSYIFQGAFRSAGWSFLKPVEGPRKDDKLIRCVLVPMTPALVIESKVRPNQVDDLLDRVPNDPASWELVARRVRKYGAAFRSALIQDFGGMCAISGETTEEVLEAAHVVPHSEAGNNELGNGILLRSDLHDLFDADLLKIDPYSLEVKFDERICSLAYTALNGKNVRKGKSGGPDKKHLKRRYRLSD